MAAIKIPAKRERFYNDMIAKPYEKGKAINMASYTEIVSVIDPADTRKRIIRSFNSLPPDTGKKALRPFVDNW